LERSPGWGRIWRLVLRKISVSMKGSKLTTREALTIEHPSDAIGDGHLGHVLGKIDRDHGCIDNCSVSPANQAEERGGVQP
jgi:hypothetical protein